MQRSSVHISGFENNYSLCFDFSIDEIEPLIATMGTRSTLLSYPFLKSIEECPPQGLKPVYAVLIDHLDQPVGFFNFQVKYFQAQQSMRLGQDEDFFCRLHLRLKSLVVNLVEFNTLVCGNLLLSGPYGYILRPDHESSAGLIYQHMIEEMQGWLRSRSLDTNVVLVKDFFQDQKVLEESTFHSFEIQPNMILDLPRHWMRFEDYLDDLHSKYRIRARRALKAANGILRREISMEEASTFRAQLYGLYKQTATHAEFNLVDLHPDYFYQLKKNLGEAFHIYTYSLKDELVAFYTVIEDGAEDEAHFLGINESLNKPYQLYLNILFDIIQSSILRKKTRTRFSRTALEIKSSVGAKAHSLTCYIKHRKVINNTFVPYLLDFLNQNQDWVPRHPFRESENQLVPIFGLVPEV